MSDSLPIHSAEVDPNRQAQARIYARLRRWLSVAELILSILAIIVVFINGLHLWLRDILIDNTFLSWQPIQGWTPWLNAAFILITIIVYTVLTLPFAIYEGFILSHRYGLVRQSFGGWLIDRGKSFVLELILILGLVEILYLLLALQPLTWWIWLIAITLFFSVVFATLMPIFILPLFYKQIPLPDDILRQRLLALAERANTKVQGAYILNMSRTTSQGNAAVMGLGRTRRIVIGDTILETYTPDEIEVILAHELGHQVHNDMWKGVFVSMILTSIGYALVNQ
jgi:STE24 endopeptidase